MDTSKITKIHKFDNDAIEYSMHNKGKERDDNYAREINKRLLAGETLFYPMYKMYIKITHKNNWMYSMDGLYFRNLAEMPTPPFFSPEKFEIVHK
jgi:hypothetical protein